MIERDNFAMNLYILGSAALNEYLITMARCWESATVLVSVCIVALFPLSVKASVSGSSKLCKYKRFWRSSAAHGAVWCHGRLNSYNTVKASLASGAGTLLITSSSPWKNLALSGSLRLIYPVCFYSLSALKHPQLRNTNSISGKCFPK